MKARRQREPKELLQLSLYIIYKKVSSTFLLNFSLFYSYFWIAIACVQIFLFALSVLDSYFLSTMTMTASGVDSQPLPAMGDHGRPPIDLNQPPSDLDGPTGDLNREGENEERPIVDLNLPPRTEPSSPFSHLSKEDLCRLLKNSRKNLNVWRRKLKECERQMELFEIEERLRRQGHTRFFMAKLILYCRELRRERRREFPSCLRAG